MHATINRKLDILLQLHGLTSVQIAEAVAATDAELPALTRPSPIVAPAAVALPIGSLNVSAAHIDAALTRIADALAGKPVPPVVGIAVTHAPPAAP